MINPSTDSKIPNQTNPPGDILDYRGIDASLIPNIEVYMDQLLTFFERSYGFLRREPKESVLTKAMINNYVKAKIMDKPVKKKYNPQQVKKLIIIYHLKHVLSIQDIQKILTKLNHSDLSMDEFYQQFLENENASYNDLADQYAKAFTQETNSEEIIHTIISLATEACAKKRLAEKLLDQLTSAKQG